MSVARAQLGASVIWCDARVSSLEWYKKRGLSPFGSTFYKSHVEFP
ncbi:acetyltransferase [Coprinopsis cinerea okayama7|uniref:Acetyltransferase n=1 Tax=Coprinopsis cinerea (strain Okayama-7 / 130 / ATCC MYA-4618 / FGSC 9003) TaxID=240176 RepID=D6RP87_COPC7|nr:acetyltransferase [Coprinopsis cinerea okayama7\|eukprot:XP_002910739.1 acetyltransferase [Coprinopsis cinerea okayama7\